MTGGTRVAAPDFYRAVLEDIAHRPWPMPGAPWLMTQTWHDLLFAHWPVDADLLRKIVPAVFPLDLFDGQAWLGIVPFSMTNVSPRGVPSLPRVSAFPELNVRTYVRVDDKPGVYFFSLDAGSGLAVQTARTLLNLPYYSATMAVTSRDGWVDYRSRRERDAPNAVLEASYRPIGAPFRALDGTLEHFLTARYCLYNLDRGGTPYRLEIHHPLWPLQTAEAAFSRNTMAAAAGISLPPTPPLLHFSKRQDMVAWAPTRLERSG
jgi:uncharacterized protein YqjF (DUF2071 family)